MADENNNENGEAEGSKKPEFTDRRKRPRDAESLLAQRQRLEKQFQDQYRKNIAVMFTDLKDSTAIAEEEGDLATRELIVTHNDIVFPIIKEYDGVLVKTMGDGTMSYFLSPQQSLRAAAKIQSTLRDFNKREDRKVPINIRVGIHTGTGIVEENDIYGDVVNTAARLEHQAGVNEIFISEATYEALDDKGEYFCKHVDTVKLKGKKDMQKIFKAYWAEDLISEDDKKASSFKKNEEDALDLRPFMRILLFFGIIVGGVYVTMKVMDYLATQPYIEDKRSIQRKVPDKD